MIVDEHAMTYDNHPESIVLITTYFFGGGVVRNK